MFIGGEQMCW